uniref:hypothetical protein n=1 Tax=Streptomyces sp. WAC 04229 TaxID=2203206 RepID=UPI003D702BA0
MNANIKRGLLIAAASGGLVFLGQTAAQASEQPARDEGGLTSVVDGLLGSGQQHTSKSPFGPAADASAS